MHSYLHLAYLCEVSIALSFAYSELAREKTFKDIEKKSESLISDIHEYLKKVSGNPERQKAMMAIRDKAANLVHEDKNKRKSAWLYDNCIESNTCLLRNGSDDRSRKDCKQSKARTNCDAYAKHKIVPITIRFFFHKWDVLVARFGGFIATLFILLMYFFNESSDPNFFIWWGAYAILAITTILPMILLVFLHNANDKFHERVNSLKLEYKDWEAGRFDETIEKLKAAVALQKPT